ncbi:MAG: hypothetical protein ACI4OR_04500 [Alphaproteobacteria bacterium]
MIKKSLFILSILLSLSVGAKELSPTLQKARQHRAELVEKQDEMLALLLQVPFEQRQYIFPMLSAKQSIPKKIKTHPQVLVWKGKKPTRIADRFKDDQELIDYLPEQFYSFLSPDAWGPQLGQNQMELNPNQILQNMIQQKSEEMSVMPEELVDIYDGLNILQEWIQQQGKQPSMPLYFEQWASTAPDDIQKQILEKTGLSVTAFGKKTDAITKSYRLYQNQKIPPASSEQKLVQEYWSLIPFIFKKTGFTDTLKGRFYQD